MSSIKNSAIGALLVGVNFGMWMHDFYAGSFMTMLLFYLSTELALGMLKAERDAWERTKLTVEATLGIWKCLLKGLRSGYTEEESKLDDNTNTDSIAH